MLREGGFVAPGYSPGVLTIDGDYTEIGERHVDDGSGRNCFGDEYDQLHVTGNVTLARDARRAIYRWLRPARRR